MLDSSGAAGRVVATHGLMLAARHERWRRTADEARCAAVFAASTRSAESAGPLGGPPGAVKASETPAERSAAGRRRMGCRMEATARRCGVVLLQLLLSR